MLCTPHRETSAVAPATAMGPEKRITSQGGGTYPASLTVQHKQSPQACGVTAMVESCPPVKPKIKQVMRPLLGVTAN